MTPERIEEIKRLLAAATAGPWEYDYEANMIWAEGLGIAEIGVFGQRINDGNLIAKSPELISELLDALEEAEKINEQQKKVNSIQYSSAQMVIAECRNLRKELAEAQQTIARQREALEGIKRIIESGEFYETADQLKSVLVSANWACAEALNEGAKET